MSSTLVTAIIRAFNRRNKISQAIESVLRQSIDSCDIIVVDDASSDGTAEFVESTYGERVRVLRHDRNKGPAGAANTGLDAVRTPFVAFLDSDDAWEPEYLVKTVDALSQYPERTLAYTNFRMELPSFNLDWNVECGNPEAIPNNLGLPPFSLSLITARTRSIRAIGGFRENTRIGEDFELYVRLWLRNPHCFIHIREPLVRHRMEDDNITQNINALLADMQVLTKAYLRHPGFRHLKRMATEVTTKRLVAITKRKQSVQWLNAEPRRPISTLVPLIENVEDTCKTLDSLSHQRLPPVEVILIGQDKEILRQVEQMRNWPFLIRLLPTRVPNESIGSALDQAWRFAAGDLIQFILPGETLPETALDDHRRAHSASIGRPAHFSYGEGAGIPNAPENAIPVRYGERLLFSVQHQVPGTLSAMVLAKSVLEKSTGLMAKPYHALWFEVVARLTGPAIRISRRVLSENRTTPMDRVDIVETLHTLSEERRGPFGAVHDYIADLYEK